MATNVNNVDNASSTDCSEYLTVLFLNYDQKSYSIKWKDDSSPDSSPTQIIKLFKYRKDFKVTSDDLQSKIIKINQQTVTVRNQFQIYMRIK